MDKVMMLGILLSLLFIEVTGLSPGGLIVPAYVCLSLQQPGRILFTLLLGWMVWMVVNQLSHHMILYGQRRFALSLATGIVLQWMIPGLGAGSSISYLVPGLMAREFERQGFWKTLASILAVSGVLWVVMAAWRGGVR